MKQIEPPRTLRAPSWKPLEIGLFLHFVGALGALAVQKEDFAIVLLYCGRAWAARKRALQTNFFGGKSPTSYFETLGL